MRPTLLILTEDSGDDAFAVLETLVRKMLRLLDAQCDFGRVKFDPADERARKAMAFNGWKERSGEGRRKRFDLIQVIATRLAREEEDFVIVHVDGDRPWAESTSGTCGENIDKFRRDIEPGIKAELDRVGSADRLDRLILLVPFWCIESWLYQNVEAALRFYKESHPNATKEIEQFKAWRDRPADLDEAPTPKKTVPRIDGHHNFHLAGDGFPVQKLMDIDKSFAHVMGRLRDCPPLRPALLSIRFPWLVSPPS